MTFTLPLADLFSVNFGSIIAIVIPLAAIIFLGVVVVTGMYFSNRRREMWHQTARLALEKGQPLPPLAEETSPGVGSARDSAFNDLRGGLICLGTGIGLYFFFDAFLGHGLAFVGAIPAFVGLALVLTGLGRLMFGGKDDPSNARPPQA